jgi:ribose transport system substrate-binding protein
MRRPLAALIVLAFVAGLNLALLTQEPVEAQRRPKLVLFTKNVTNPFWKAVRVGAEKAAKALGADLEHAAPTKPDNIEEQTRLVEDWIVKKPDAFVFVPVDYKALVPSIEKVNKAGIPVVIFSNRMAGVDSVSYVGSDDETIGYELAKYLFRNLGGRGKVIHIEGVPAAITAQNRKKGFERALREHPQIELLASQPGNYRRLPAVQVMENLMQRFPAIDAVFCANDDMAVGVVEALEAAGRGGKTKVVGIDAIPDAAAAIAKGRMLASADYSGHDQGFLAVSAAVRSLRGERVPKEIALPVVIVDKSNAQGWLIPVEDKPAPDWAKVIAIQSR